MKTRNLFNEAWITNPKGIQGYSVRFTNRTWNNDRTEYTENHIRCRLYRKSLKEVHGILYKMGFGNHFEQCESKYHYIRFYTEE